MNSVRNESTNDFDFRSMFNLKGKTAVVTGGVGLLGNQMLNALSEFGADVVILDIREEEGMQQARDLQEKYGVRAEFVTCDVASEAQVVRSIQGIVKKFQKIDILINNAAGKSDNLEEFFMNFEKYSFNEWQTIINTNLNGMFLVAREVGRVMVELQTKGSIIQVSSIYGLVAPDQRIYEGSSYLGRAINSPAVYSASKAGVIGLTRYLASYWGASGIRVNNLIPGGVYSGQNDVFVKQYSNRVPLARMAQAYEIAASAIFLASDASSYITGQDLVVDGGLSCW